jgi:tetratricopeptide (TPR) repeat protein
MKLRRRFSSQQLIFALGLTLSFATMAAAQDKLTTLDGRTQDGKIVGVVGSSVQIQVGAGTIGVPLATVKAVTMAVPAEFTTGKAAYDARDFAKALAPIKAVADKFRGLPAPWAQQASGLLGDIYVALNKLPEAEAAYLSFQKSYGAGGGLQSEVGLARIALSKKEYDKAKEKLTPITEKALTEKQPAAAVASAYSQAFYILAQVEEAQGDYSAALQNYLRTVTIFHHDSAAAAGAKEKADALRKAHNVVVP